MPDKKKPDERPPEERTPRQRSSTDAGYDDAARGGAGLPYDPVPFDDELGPDERARSDEPVDPATREGKQQILEAIDQRAERDAVDEVRRRERSADKTSA